MRQLLVVNPNTSAAVTALLQQHVQREAGADVMILETGTSQPEAMALYEAAGYASVEPFGHYAWSPRNRCYARALDDDEPGPV